MQKIGFIGIGKIGLPICDHLIKKGYTVIGYRRSSLADFEKLGGVPARSPPMSVRRRTSSSLACRTTQLWKKSSTERKGF